MTKARSNATANAAKGDLTVGNGTNLSGVLGVGSNGDTIVADSSTSTGLRYTAGTTQGNPIINSAFQVWQRGTSISYSGGNPYTADRFTVSPSGAAIVVSRQATGDTTNLPFIQYCARVQRTAGNAVAGNNFLIQTLETVNSIPYAGKTITFSFYARKGANYSASSSILSAAVLSGTGTDQSIATGLTGSTDVLVIGATLTTTWQRFTGTATVAASATQIGFYTVANFTGTAGAADFYEVTGFQIDIGSVALPFRTYAGTIQGELAACQRYYEQSYPDGTAAGTASVLTNAEFLFSTTNIGNGNTVKNCNYAVTKRGTPTITIYGYQGGSGKVSNANGIDLAANSGIASGIGTKRFYAYNNSGADIATALNGFIFHWVASAEL